MDVHVDTLNLREPGQHEWLLSKRGVEAVREAAWQRLQAYPSGPSQKPDKEALLGARQAAWCAPAHSPLGFAGHFGGFHSLPLLLTAVCVCVLACARAWELHVCAVAEYHSPVPFHDFSGNVLVEFFYSATSEERGHFEETNRRELPRQLAGTGIPGREGGICFRRSSALRQITFPLRRKGRKCTSH